jgi:large repetitive protein
VIQCFGNRLTAKDPLGKVTTYTYNAANRPTSVKDPLERATAIETDFKERVTAVVDPLGNRKEFAYDGSGNLTQVSEGAAVTYNSYDSANRLIARTDPEGNATRFEYASAGCPTCGGSTETPMKITDPLGNVTQNSFDKAGKVIGITDPLFNLTALVRDAAGRVKSRIDANNNDTGYQYDALSRVVNQTDANGGVTAFAYDSLGNLVSLTDPNGHSTSFEYDLAGRKTKETRPMGQVSEYTYYPSGLLKTVKDAKGQVSSYGYDAASHLTSVTYADGKKDSFGYDAAGNLTSYGKDGVSGVIGYDELGRKTSETVNYGAFSKTYGYSYDPQGNKASFTSPEGKAYIYGYDKNKQPTQIAYDGRTIGLEYQATRLAKSTLPNGVANEYQYNTASWLSTITAKTGAGTLANSQYGFDKVGTITAIATEKGSHAYGYDPTYQLSSASHPALAAEAFSYDVTGNRNSGGYSSDANNELTASDTAIFSYDRNGNTTQKKAGEEITGYTYNSADRLESIQLPGGSTATYTYDPFGRRIKKDVAGEVTYYAYADEGLIGEYDATGSLKKGYGWKPGGVWGTDPVFMVEDGDYYFYQNDHLGTPQKLTDGSGNVVWSAEYSAFGQAVVDTASTIENNLRFPGQYFDEETNLQYNWNRYYDPVTGKYTVPDPVGAGINPYYYSVNNPLKNIDPFGLFCSKKLDRAMKSKSMAYATNLTSLTAGVLQAAGGFSLAIAAAPTGLGAYAGLMIGIQGLASVGASAMNIYNLSNGDEANLNNSGVIGLITSVSTGRGGGKLNSLATTADLTMNLLTGNIIGGIGVSSQVVKGVSPLAASVLFSKTGIGLNAASSLITAYGTLASEACGCE